MNAMPVTHCICRDPGGILLIGVGNEYRNDDGLGLFVARELRRRSLGGVTIVERSDVGASLIEVWAGRSAVLLVDAVVNGGAPGLPHRLDASCGPLPRSVFHYSSHSIGLAEAIELARELHRLPPKVIVYGIECEVFDAGVGLSPRVVRAIPELLGLIEHDVRLLLSQPLRIKN